MTRPLVKRIIGMIAMAAAVAGLHVARAETPGWNQTRYSVASGAPTSVIAVARTPDGYLWLGSWDGLYRFNGFVFERLVREPGPYPKSETVRTMLVASNGDLWVGHDWGGVSVVRHGRYLPVGQNVTGSTITELVEGPDRKIRALNWLDGAVRLWTFEAGRWRVTTVASAERAVLGAIYDKDRRLWLATDDALWVAEPRDKTARRAADLKSSPSGLSRSPDGRIWLVEADGLREVGIDSRSGRYLPGARIALPSVAGGQQILFDPLGGFWRLSRERSVERYSLSAGHAATRVTIADSLPNQLASLEPNTGVIDAEGLLWVAGELGVDRFRRVSLQSLPTVQNLPVGRFGAYAAYRDGVGDIFLRMGPKLLKVSGTAELMPLTDGLLRTDMPCASPRGGVWARDASRHFILHGGPQPRRLPAPAYLPPNIYSGACGEDGQGRLWVASDPVDLALIGTAGHVRVDLQQDAGFEVTSIASYPPGPLLAYAGNGTLWQQHGDGLATLWSGVGRAIGFLEFSYKSGPYIYWGGPDGLARWDGKRTEWLTSRDVPYLNRLAGMVQTARGETWLLNADGILRLQSADLDRAFAKRGFQPRYRLLNYEDGLPGKVRYNNASNLVEDRWGRIWVVTSAGIAMLDPARPVRNGVAPPIQITTITAGSRTYPARGGLVLPAGTSRVVIAFDGLSLAQPERNRFRYRITGVDDDWVDSGSQRQAVYSGLGPGTYRFEVLAANNDGVWAARPRTVEFRIQPLFHQTYWFYGLCVLAAILIIFLAIRLRVRIASARIRSRVEAQADERERIAREIHDTLLQSVQGLSLRVHAVAEQLGARSPAHRPLVAALDQADRTIGEARARIAGLRPPVAGDSLRDLVSQTVEAARRSDAPTPSTIVDGDERPVDPVVMGELRAVLDEALRNIAWHAEASEAWVIIRFGARALEMVVEDNGVGVPPEIEEQGYREGHFGLADIFARVAKLQGQARIERRDEGGTRLVVSVPARTAYRERGLRSGLSALWSGRRP